MASARSRRRERAARPSEASLADLLVQIKITNRLLAVQLKADMKQQELIGVLASTGASPREIAEVLDTTPATVTVAIGRLRRRSQQAVSSDEADSSGSDESAPL